jgi:purine-binding chemotaxis protein CheW
MSKQLFANEIIMKQYLDALLLDEPEASIELEPVQNLLRDVEQKVAQYKQERLEKAASTPLVTHSEINNTNTSQDVADNLDAKAQLVHSDETFSEAQFQALFFEVAGLKMAVPLKALGGIYQVSDITHLFGKPNWFKGVMINREEKLNVVDTARWVMPEKYNKTLEEALNYQYLIMLGESNWGLLAERLIDNVTMTHDDVKWREQSGKRPWLAGLMKKEMCALVNVPSMIKLLDCGLDSRDK